MNKTLLASLFACALVLSSAHADAQCLTDDCQAAYEGMYPGSATVSVQQPAVSPAVYPVLAPPHPWRRPGMGFGLKGNFSYSGGNELTLYGAGGLFRFLTGPRFGLELSADAAGGERGWACMVGMSGLVFFNIRHRVQPYVLAGVDFTPLKLADQSVNVSYLGGHLGAGLEILVGRRVGLSLEVRSFLQGLHDRPDELEAVYGDLEYGVTLNTGLQVYFPRFRR